MAADNKVERHIGKQKLLQLLAKSKVASSEMAEIRGGLGSKLKSAQEADGLNMWAFNQSRRLMNQDPRKAQADMRALQLYCDMIGLWDQADLLDTQSQMPDTRTPVEMAIDGDPAEARRRQAEVDEREAKRRATVDSLLQGKADSSNVVKLKPEQTGDADPETEVENEGSQEDDTDAAKLVRFKASLEGAETDAAVTTGYAKFCDDHPDLAEQAEIFVQDRLAAINAQAKPPIPQRMASNKPRQQPKPAQNQHH
jgi:hypothetical protein